MSEPGGINPDAMREERADPDLVLDAMAYVEEVHKAMTAENTAPPPGVEGRVVAAILADAALADYVRRWASASRALEAHDGPPELPPVDSAYRRVSEMLTAAGAESGS